MKKIVSIVLLALSIAVLAVVSVSVSEARERTEAPREHRSHEDHNDNSSGGSGGGSETEEHHGGVIVVPPDLIEELIEDIENGDPEAAKEKLEDYIEEQTGGGDDGEGSGDTGEGNEEEEEAAEEQNDRVRDRNVTRTRDPQPQPPAEEDPTVEEEEQPQPPAEEESNEGDEDPTYLEEIASEIHRLTNIQRENEGLDPLVNDDALGAVATAHSQWMADTNIFSHLDLEGCDAGCRMDASNYDYNAWGENIAWRSSTTLHTAEELAAMFVQMWMNSSGHRDNILSENFTNTGIGLGQLGNKIFVTADFAKQ